MYIFQSQMSLYSQARVPLIERIFLYKVKRKEEDRDQKTAVCLERETRQLDCHCFHSNWFPSKERCSHFLTISPFNDQYKNTSSRAFQGPKKEHFYLAFFAKNKIIKWYKNFNTVETNLKCFKLHSPPHMYTASGGHIRFSQMQQAIHSGRLSQSQLERFTHTEADKTVWFRYSPILLNIKGMPWCNTKK